MARLTSHFVTGIYIVDRRAKSVEDSVTQLTDQMVSFCQKTRRQRINQRNRTERLSDLLDWKRMGLEYAKARQLALRRAYPDSFADDEFDMEGGDIRIPRPMSAPGSPRFLSGTMTPGDIGTLTEVRLTCRGIMSLGLTPDVLPYCRRCSISVLRTTWVPKAGRA